MTFPLRLLYHRLLINLHALRPRNLFRCRVFVLTTYNRYLIRSSVTFGLTHYREGKAWSDEYLYTVTP